jgi:hypothetical protein
MHYFANLIYSHPSHELIERGGAIGTRAVFNLDDGSKLASAVKPLWTNTQHWEKVVFAAVLWAGGSSHFPHVDACHTTFKLYDTHGDIARSRGAQHEDGPEFHWFNARGYRGRVVILAFVFTDSAIDEQYINYIDGISGDKVTKGNTLSQGHMSGGTNSAYLDGDLKYSGNQDVLSLGPKTVTTESCSHRFGDAGCGATITRTSGLVTAWNTSGLSTTVDVTFAAPLPLSLDRYIAGMICPVSGAAQGNANDITSIVFLGDNVYCITLGSTPRVPWQRFSTVVVGNGCTKTLAACNANGRLPYMWAMPFTPGTKSFLAGSELVNPSGPGIP